MFKIYIIEDDDSIAKNLKLLLENWDYDSVRCQNYNNVISEMKSYDPHLVLLDINLPKYDGFYFCREIRNVSKLPIIMVSARDGSMDMVMALNMGADDFIPKPYKPELLLARIQAHLRRSYSYTDCVKETIEHKDFILNITSGQLLYKGKLIELTKNEFKILGCLLTNKGKIISRDELMEALWSTDIFVDDNTLTVNINRLRKKMISNGIDDPIKTRKNLGYTIEEIEL